MNSSSELLADGDSPGLAAPGVADARPSRPGRGALKARKHRVVQVWDPALRLFHWTLAVTIVAAVVTGETGGAWIEWHGRLGIVIAGLLGFRLVWGLVGPDTARFAQFVRGPAAIRTYLRGQWQGTGHNPLGALSVIALLGLGTLQVTSGLFSNDDIAFQGPLAALVSAGWSDHAGSLHQRLSWLLFATIALHLAAIAWYRLAKRRDLVTPMITGVEETSGRATDGAAPPHAVAPDGADWRWRNLAAAAGGGLVCAGLASGLLLPASHASAPVAAPPAAAAGARPAW